MEGKTESGPAAAPLRARLLAAGADFVVVAAIGLAVDEALRLVLAEIIGVGFPPGHYAASMFIGGWVYFVFCETRFGGRTVGKMGAGLRVAGSGDALWCSVRYVAKVLQLLVGRGLLFGVALFDERRRALHDHLAGTVVVVDTEPSMLHRPTA